MSPAKVEAVTAYLVIALGEEVIFLASFHTEVDVAMQTTPAAETGVSSPAPVGQIDKRLINLKPECRHTASLLPATYLPKRCRPGPNGVVESEPGQHTLRQT